MVGQKTHQYFRQFSTIYCENIQRGLLRVTGNEVHEFLQGLITNDISHINNTADCDNALYTMFLNKQGRVLYDTIIYKQRMDKTSCFIECDHTVDEQLKQHLLCFRLRKNIKIDVITQEVNIWACFQDSSNVSHKITDNFPVTHKQKYRELGAVICADPRPQLGMRIIAPKNFQIQDFQRITYDKNCVSSTTLYNYIKHRYSLGICEGVMEIPPSKIYPFEVNVDYLHGISFHKGCYLGQEFTARTHHTGVIRKRIMPLHFSTNVTSKISDLYNYDEPILNENNQVVGKLKGVQNEFGIGLLKVDLALSSSHLKMKHLDLSTYQPTWWPKKNN